MEISPISGALGAEISGIDISKKLTNTETQLLQENFLKFKVLFFRNQNLSAERGSLCRPRARSGQSQDAPK